MFYILDTDFFSTSTDLEAVAYELDKRVGTERIVINHDPFSCDKFTKLVEDGKEEELLELARAYYSDLESLNKYQLKWYELNHIISYYIDTLEELNINFNFHDYHVSSCGVLPLVYSGMKCFIYFHVSPYEDLEDVFNIISLSDFTKILNKHKIGELV